MNQIIKAIIKLRKTILIAFAVALVAGILVLPLTEVNYKMVDYLPQDANSTRAIEVLSKEFEGGLPNLSVMISDLSVQEALDYKEQLKQINGVTSVLWLDDILGKDLVTKQPIEFLDQGTVEAYYKDGYALFTLEIADGLESDAIASIYALIGEGNQLYGDALTSANTQNSSASEVRNAMFILLPIVIIVLIIATISWLEPILFMITIGVAILINMGTNALLGEVSFITQTVSPILQMAVSMDYAIFLLHSFTEMRKKYEPKEAMFHAMKASLPTVAASALTTIIGFSALVFMRFEIGSDLGLNLLKGIIFSFLAVMIFLPVVSLIFYKWIDKTMHKDFLPHPGKLSSILVKTRIPFFILSILIVVPMYLAQSNVSFIYGMPSQSESRDVRDKAVIDDVFGTSQLLLLMVPNEDVAREKALADNLAGIPHVKQVVSYATNVGTKIPATYVPDAALTQFYSENYARIILYTDLPSEGEVTFSTVEQILATTKAYYNDYYLTGEGATMTDMRNVVNADMGPVNLIAIIGIFVILLITFRSLTLPLILIFTIESAIWINLAIPYFTDTPISFIGYLIISTVQLGATVDYAILMTHKYIEERRRTGKREAMWDALKNNIAAVLVSATILASAGFVLAATTNNGMIKELGNLLGRGTVLSFFMVAAVLPALLIVFDKAIQWTTLGHRFYNEKEHN